MKSIIYICFLVEVANQIFFGIGAPILFDADFIGSDDFLFNDADALWFCVEVVADNEFLIFSRTGSTKRIFPRPGSLTRLFLALEEVVFKSSNKIGTILKQSRILNTMDHFHSLVDRGHFRDCRLHP